jgi:hypothetical protein
MADDNPGGRKQKVKFRNHRNPPIKKKQYNSQTVA